MINPALLQNTAYSDPEFAQIMQGVMAQLNGGGYDDSASRDYLGSMGQLNRGIGNIYNQYEQAAAPVPEKQNFLQKIEPILTTLAYVADRTSGNKRRRNMADPTMRQYFQDKLAEGTRKEGKEAFRQENLRRKLQDALGLANLKGEMATTKYNVAAKKAEREAGMKETAARVATSLYGYKKQAEDGAKSKPPSVDEQVKGSLLKIVSRPNFNWSDLSEQERALFTLAGYDIPTTESQYSRIFSENMEKAEKTLKPVIDMMIENNANETPERLTEMVSALISTYAHQMTRGQLGGNQQQQNPEDTAMMEFLSKESNIKEAVKKAIAQGLLSPQMLANPAQSTMVR